MKFSRRILCAAGLGLLVVSTAPAHAVEVNAYPELTSMIEQLVSENGLDRQRLNFWLADARINQDIIQAMQRPAERLPWHRYRQRFPDSIVNTKRRKISCALLRRFSTSRNPLRYSGGDPRRDYRDRDPLR